MRANENERTAQHTFSAYGYVEASATDRANHHKQKLEPLMQGVPTSSLRKASRSLTNGRQRDSGGTSPQRKLLPPHPSPPPPHPARLSHAHDSRRACTPIAPSISSWGTSWHYRPRIRANSLRADPRAARSQPCLLNRSRRSSGTYGMQFRRGHERFEHIVRMCAGHDLITFTGSENIRRSITCCKIGGSGEFDPHTR